MTINNWKKCKLGDVATTTTTKISCSDITSNYISTENMLPDKGGIVAASSLPNSGNVSIYHKGDVLVSNIRPYFKKIWHATVDGAASNDVIVFHANEGVNSRYLYYTLADDNFFAYVMTGAKGTKMPRGDRKQILQYPVNLPSLEEQKRIAEILGSLDDKIELLQKQNKTLEDMAKALFKSWFVDFDVVRAKQKGLPKADIMREYHLTEELYDLFPSSFADSPLGPIPSGWEVKPLSKIATFLNGLALQKYPARAEEDFLPVIKIAELRNGISTSTDKANTNLPTEYIVHNGDILFSWSGSLMVKVWSGEKGALNQHLFKVFSNGYPKWFYYLWVNHYLPMFQEIAADKATTMGHIQRKHLDQAKVVCPSAAFLDKMDKIFGVILSKIILNNKQIQTLTELRNTLLPRLISGKIRV